MNRFDFWRRWLFVVGLAVTVFGVLMALFNGTAMFELFNRQIDSAFWGAAGPPPGAAAFQRWVYGTWGATIAGWGVFIAWIAWYPYRRRELWTRSCMAAGLAVWYILDTGVSLHFGVVFNAAFNTLLLIFLGVPLGLTWKGFASGANPETTAPPPQNASPTRK